MPKLDYRLGLDVGANSLGWCVYGLDTSGEPCRIVRMGSRVFADGRDPKSLASLAATRRQARQSRRRRDRVLKRRQRLMEGLVRYGLMPESNEARKALQALDPYELRAKGLDQSLTPYEFGRALYHLARKRGFRSSRKDAGNPEDERETGMVKEAIHRLREQIVGAGCRTAGEYLARQHAERRPVRARRSSDGQYVLYLQRDMVAEEFKLLWEAQRSFHPELLTTQAHDYLLDTLLFQRKLLQVMPGRCLFDPDDYRAPLCSPLQQRFRILQELNNLRLIEGPEQRPLTLAERNLLADRLTRNQKLTFAALRKAIGHGPRSPARFNLESEKRKDLKGDLVSAQLARPECIGETWFQWPQDRQEALALLVARTDQRDELVAALTGQEWKLTLDQADAISRCRMPDDYGSLGHNALQRIVPELEREVVTYDVAVQRAGYMHHSQLHTGEFFQRLPYYGQVLRGYTSPADKAQDPDERQYGKLPNPTVHIGLNQIRQLINALIKRYGHPREIVIELAREFGVSGERRREMIRLQAENQARNERYDAQLARLGQRPTRENRLKLRLWEELGKEDALDRYCVYSGKRLSFASLFSDEVEIDHILPFSRSLHDGVGNKILCTRQANRDKGSRTPYDAFGQMPAGYDWQAIMARVERTFAASTNPSVRAKARLFREDALEAFLGEKDFLDRHLTDTAYLGRAAKQYLSYICHKDHVWVSSGKLTGMLRGKWGLNSLLSDDARKNRNDHRHHALDAAVVGVCSRSLIMRMSRAAHAAEIHGENRLLERLALPWPGFREDLRDTLQKIIVSHKPDHSREGRLHNDTNYGWRGEADRRGVPLVGRRVPIETIETLAHLEGISSEPLRQQLQALIAPLTSKKEIRNAIGAFSKATGIRRYLKEERLSVIPIADRRTSVPYRYVKGDGNYCYDIILRADGRWDVDIVSVHAANNDPHFDVNARQARDGAPVAMRLCKGDLLALEIDGSVTIWRVALFSTNGVALCSHFEGNVDARDRDSNDPFKYVRKSPEPLRKAKARLVGVDILGYVNDPGFRT